RCSDICRDCGFSVTLENWATIPEQIVFGQSRPVFVNGEWTMVRDYRKVLSQGTSSHIYLNNPATAVPWLRGVAICEGHVNAGVPVLQAWSKALLEGVPYSRKVNMSPHLHYAQQGINPLSLGRVTQSTVSDETRASFERAFGLTPDEQRRLEDSFQYDINATVHQRAWDSLEAQDCWFN
ncbi:hypothetical protein AB8Y46_15685, partial [Listeria monocytogenes]|uniref:hypothetical protein n=1 Tax=Listeria monocytogenes TaxID=1639 RepID=UPI00350E4FFC